MDAGQFHRQNHGATLAKIIVVLRGFDSIGQYFMFPKVTFDDEGIRVAGNLPYGEISLSFGFEPDDAMSQDEIAAGIQEYGEGISSDVPH